MKILLHWTKEISTLCYCHRWNKREVSLTPWGYSSYLSAAVSQHWAAALQYYTAYVHGKCPSDRRLQELLLLLAWWPCLNHPDKVYTSSTDSKLYSSAKGAWARPKAQPTFHSRIRTGSCYLGSSRTLSKSEVAFGHVHHCITQLQSKNRDKM